MNYVEKCFFKVSFSVVIREDCDLTKFEEELEKLYASWETKNANRLTGIITSDDPDKLRAAAKFVIEEDDAINHLRIHYESSSGNREIEFECELELSESIYRYYWRSRWVLTLVTLSINSLRTSMRIFRKGAGHTRHLGVRWFKKLTLQG